ncbi:793_t:CDS:2 [Dentiscutata erythropus]|uniref:793_t:CDS:1 n=1 Tax=Dentiscutata erythropus TaxID=1348616 RepID=A0A9N9DGX0_9GLOM|nr:793_t:CDS:2 [Dentiscutata erythropus]
MSKLPKFPSGSSVPVSALPSPAGRRRSSTGTAQKSTTGLKGLTPEQEALLHEAMEKYKPVDANKANEFNFSSISTLNSQSDLSFPSTTTPNSNNQSNISLRKPGARRPSISKVTRQPLLPPLSEIPTGVSTELPTSTTQPQALPSKYSLNNSGHQSSPQRSFLTQNQYSTTGSPSTNILPVHPRLQSVATSPRPASPSLSQFSIGDRVVAESMNIVGTLKFLGPIDIKAGTWAGVEVDIPGTGKNDGSVNGKSYFTCPPKSGIFILPSKLSKVDKEPASLPQASTSIKPNPSAHKLPRPSSTSTNSSDKEYSGIPSADPNISKNAQNAALAASRITAGSRASKYIGVTASQLKQRTKPTNIITTPIAEPPASRDQYQTPKKTSGLARPTSNNNLKSLSLSQPSVRSRTRSNSSSSNGSAISSTSQSASHPRSRYQNQPSDTLSPSDSDMTVIAPINEEMSNKSLQEQVKKLLNDSGNSENIPLSLFDQQALRIQQLQMKIEVLEGENARLKLDDKKLQTQSDTGKLNFLSRPVEPDTKESWEIEKISLLEEKESMEKELNEKIEELAKKLQEASKGQNFRPSTSLSQIADDDLMNDNILQLTELIEQKDEQIKSLEESFNKLTKQSNEYQTKIAELEKINSERADKIEQLATLGYQNSQTEASDRVAQLEKVIQEKSTEIVQLTGNVESIRIESDGKMRTLQETIDELKSAGQETINIYELKVSSLEQQVEDLKKAGVETISLYEEATNKVTERDTKISLLEKEAEELRSAGVEAIDVYEKTIEGAKREMENTKNQLARKEESLSAANKEIERLRLLQKELTETKTKREEGLRNELADLQTGLEHMMRADAKSRERIYQLEDEVRDSQALVSRQQEEISALKNNMQNLMAANNDEEIEKVKEVFESDIKRLQYELGEARKLLSDTQSEKRALVGELDVIKDEKKLIEKKLQDNEKERQDIITEMDVLKGNMLQNENERTQLITDIEEYKVNIAKIEEHKTNIIKDAEAEKSTLMESHEDLRKELIEARESAQKDLEELQQQLKNKDSYADQLKSELDTKIAEIKQLNVEFDSFKKDVENSKTAEDSTMSSQDSIKLKTENEQLKKKIKDLAISTKTTEETTQKIKEYEEKVSAYEEQISGLKHIVQELTRENVSIASDNKKILAEQEKLMEAHRQVENECLKLMDELERLHSESLGGQGILSLSPPVEDSYEADGTSSVDQEISEEGETSHVGTDASRLQSLLVEKQSQLDRLSSKHNAETRDLRQKIQELERSKQREITALNKDVAELESLIESKIFREADLEEEVQRERRNVKKWKDDFEELKEQLNKMSNSDETNLLETSILGNGLIDGGSSSRTNKTETSNLYCEICEESGHDIISCKVVFGSHSSASNASSDTAVDGFTGNHKDERPYCDNCEEHGLHWTEDCPNQDETF